MTTDDWREANEFPDLLIRVRQFALSGRWFTVQVWDGTEGGEVSTYIVTAKQEPEAIRKAAKTYRTGGI